MIGVEPLHAGMASFQAMFSSGPHFTGKLVSGEVLFRFGPRHCGQLSADAAMVRRSRASERAGLIPKQDTTSMMVGLPDVRAVRNGSQETDAKVRRVRDID